MRWSRLDKWNVVLVLVGATLLALWLALPSSLFLRTISLTVEGDRVRFIRETPYGEVTAKWFTELRLDDGFTCAPDDWVVTHYEVVQDGSNTVTFAVWDWARPCIDAMRPYYMTTTRVVLIGGVIPLRAETITTGPVLPMIPMLPLAPPPSLVAPQTARSIP